MFKSYRPLTVSIMAALLAATSPALKIPGYVKANFSKPKNFRTGKAYPHSSARQNARTTRQLAAGQLDFSASRF